MQYYEAGGFYSFTLVKKDGGCYFAQSVGSTVNLGIRALRSFN